MISVIWWTWRVFASSWNTMPPACSTRSNTVRIFSIASRETSTPACAFWFASAAKPNASRARAALSSIARGDLAAPGGCVLAEQLLLLATLARDLADAWPRSPRAAASAPSTLRVSSCASARRGRRRLHVRRPARAGSSTCARCPRARSSVSSGKRGATGAARSVGARSPRLDPVGRGEQRCERARRARATGSSRARRRRRARRTGATQGATATPAAREQRGDTTTAAAPRPASPATNLCESATRTRGVSAPAAALLDAARSRKPSRTRQLRSARQPAAEVRQPGRAASRGRGAALDPADLGHPDAEAPRRAPRRRGPGPQR